MCSGNACNVNNNTTTSNADETRSPCPQSSGNVTQSEKETDSGSFKTTATQSYTLFPLEEQKKMVSELFNDSSLVNANSNVHHAALCTDTCDLSSKDPKKWSKEKHRFKHKMLCDYETSFSDKTGLWWLVYVEGEGMYCLLCRKHKGVNPNEFFCSKAGTRFRKEAIVDHMKTKSHKAAELEECVQRISPFEKEITDKNSLPMRFTKMLFNVFIGLQKKNFQTENLYEITGARKNEALQSSRSWVDKGNDDNYWRCSV